MRSPIRKAFLTGLFGFPLAAGLGMAVGMVSANIATGGDALENFMTLSNLKDLLFVVFFSTFMGGIFIVSPVYLLVGCTIWFLMHKLKITSKALYLLSVAIVALATTYYVFGDSSGTSGHGNGNRLVTTVQDGKLTADGWKELIAYSVAMLICSLPVGYKMWKYVFESAKHDS